MRRLLVVLTVLAACGGGGGDDADDAAGPDAQPGGPRLVVPDVIALPYVEAGSGGAMLDVTVTNPGDQDVHPTWVIEGAGFAIVEAPSVVAAGGDAVLSVRWDGAAAESVAGTTLAI